MNNFGIDFGTTNSSAFELSSRQAYGDEGARPLPSIVVIDKATDQIFCGRQAWNDRLSLTERGGYHVIPSVKSLLETDCEWFSAQKRWTVIDVVAAVLRQLNRQATDTGGITEATFSIPIGMSPKARRNLREAARLAGIEVTNFVKESTAAVIRHWEAVKNCRYVVVFDWGGGTLDVSVLELTGHQVRELATLGSPIAGDQLDGSIARFVHHTLMEKRKSTTALEDLPESQQDELRYGCERAKCALAKSPESDFALLQYDGRDETVHLTRVRCEPVIESHVTAALDLLANAISRARLSVDVIDDIIIIGGCSQLWLFRDRLQNDPRFRGRYRLAEKPEWDVAHGAAILQRSPGCFALGESLALQLSDGAHHELVRCGDRSGTERSVSLALVEDSRAANIIIQRQLSAAAEPETTLQFSIPTQGFDLEEIRLDYLLTEDLTFRLTGQSLAKNKEARVERETGELRFTYTVDEES